MARKRMLNPMLWDDPDLIEVTPVERLLFIGLISFSDDYGHVTGNPAMLRKWVFGYDDITVAQVKTMRDHITEHCRNVAFYVVDGQEYLWLKTWERHQDLRFRALAQYPCHACGLFHDAKDYKACAEQPVRTAYSVRTSAQVCARTTQELRQDLPPRGEKRREEKSNHLRGETSVSPQAPEKRGAVPAENKPEANGIRGAGAVPARLVQPVFAVLARRCGYDAGRLTKSERGELNKAAVDLVLAEYGPDDANTMADNYAGHFDGCVMTPSAIAKHATRLMEPAERAKAGNGKDVATVTPLTPEESDRAYPEYAA